MEAGRRNTLYFITTLASRHGAVILSGANGAGKTILTLQVAYRIMKE